MPPLPRRREKPDTLPAWGGTYSGFAARVGEMVSSAKIIEAYLRSERADRLEKGILASEVRVIDNLLANGLAMESAYDEIIGKVPPGFWAYRPIGEPWHHVINAIVSTAAFFSPEKLSVRRSAVRRVQELSDDIAAKSRELAQLLRTRSDYKNAHSITGPDDHHPIDVLAHAAKTRECVYLFEHWVMPRLGPVRSDFGLKYWPRTADFLDAIAEMQDVEIRPHDGIDAAAMDSRQGQSPRDFVRSLDSALGKLRTDYGIRTDFTHRTIAEIANCALAIPADNALTRESVKALRSYQRRRG
ncbi:MAG: hypothetical protein FHK80_00845 [Azoarcus sp. PHD]|nr:MAG: hypothetical protein FHK80_00845 [Azoarcus sp. PHD]